MKYDFGLSSWHHMSDLEWKQTEVVLAHLYDFKPCSILICSLSQTLPYSFLLWHTGHLIQCLHFPWWWLEWECTLMYIIFPLCLMFTFSSLRWLMYCSLLLVLRITSIYSSKCTGCSYLYWKANPCFGLRLMLVVIIRCQWLFLWITYTRITARF